MYYPIGYDNLDYRYFFIYPKNIDIQYYKQVFLKNAKVKKDSYAEKFIGRIYDIITTNVVDLKNEYYNYYYEEYSTFELFLYNKYLIDYEKLEDFKEYKDENYTIYFGDLKDNEGYPLATLIQENPSLIKSINKIFKECINEN